MNLNGKKRVQKENLFTKWLKSDKNDKKKEKFMKVFGEKRTKITSIDYNVD